jgi:hypothetical protein
VIGLPIRSGAIVSLLRERSDMHESTGNGSTSNISLKAAAIQYAQLGYRVFPLAPGTKIPYIKGGFHRGTTDVEKVAQWWAWHPWDNIGLWPFEYQKVVDVDTMAGHGKDGLSGYNELVARLGPLPDTGPLAETPSDGLHIWVACSVKDFKDKLCDGVDVKGHTGYVVAPPSIIDKRDPKAKVYGPYRWIRPILSVDTVDKVAEVSQDWDYEIRISSYMRNAHLLPPREEFDSEAEYVRLLKFFETTPTTTVGFYRFQPTPEQRRMNARLLVSMAPRRTTYTTNGDGSGAVKSLLARAEFVAETGNGNRNRALNWAAYRSREDVAAGRITKTQVVQELYQASRANGHLEDDKERMVLRTIASGLGGL